MSLDGVQNVENDHRDLFYWKKKQIQVSNFLLKVHNKYYINVCYFLSVF
jgi:hypothetical protein